MRKHAGTVVVFVVLTVVAGAVAWQALGAGESADAGGPGDDVRPIAVELARVERDLIRDVRVLSGTLEASTRFTVAAEVAGVLRQLSVDLGSEVEPDTVIGKIDDAPLLQAVAESEAELEVRRAELGRAGTNLDLRQREFERETSLLEDGVTAEAAYDVALADLRAAESTY
ncbi:MAG: biotin/lipoyl-binding protein [Planctomycetota bacterium]